MASSRALHGIEVSLTVGLVALILLSFPSTSLASTVTLTEDPGVVRWQVETVDTNGISYGAIAVDSVGYPHISYETDSSEVFGHDRELTYAQWTGTQWITETVANAWIGTVGTSLALDGNDHAHISYGRCFIYGCEPRYAEWTGSDWTVTEDVDGFGSLALDTNGDPHIGYRIGNVAGMLSLGYTSRTASSWMTSTVEAGSIEIGVRSLALDKDDNPHMSYWNGNNLKYAYWNDGQWSTQVVDDVSSTQPYRLGQQSSLVLDANENPHIAYYNVETEDLYYAEWSGTEWLTQAVDTVGDVGQFASLVIDGNGLPHISYFDASNNTVKHAFWTGIGWRKATVDIGGAVTSLAVDDSGRFHLSYASSSANDRELRYALGEVIPFTHRMNFPVISVSAN